MPEGPEIRLEADRLAAVLDGERIDAAFCALPALARPVARLAGIGNYLRSEILFFAGLAPGLRPMDLDQHALDRLAQVSLAVTRRAYQARGVTNPHRRVQALKAAGAKRSDYRYAVFAREGQPCHDCGATILRTEAGARRLYWCPRCQGAG